MNPLKEAFSRIKEDIISLKNEINALRSEIIILKELTNKPTNQQTIPSQNINPTNNSTDIPTEINNNWSLEDLKRQNMNISTGNRGVPTDRPTDQQTNQQTNSISGKVHAMPKTKYEGFEQNTSSPFPVKKEVFSDFKEAKKILDSLDEIKRGIRLKFKGLTNQEMIVFSTLYGLEEEKITEISYKSIAKTLNLSESSIRDYINRLILKGIPIEKHKQNNKKINLKISKDLKNMATLDTILKLRDI